MNRDAPNAPRFSVVTVTFNAATVLGETARSLQQQSLRAQVQWVLKDGGSRDETLSTARAFAPDLLLSAADGGIYDAMNQAVQACHGEWIYFLNAGDRLADAKVLADVAASITADPAVDLLYGDVIYFGDQGERQRRFHWLSRRRLLFSDLCHQAVFVRRDLFQRCGSFDTTLRWNADFDWLLRVFGHGARLRYLPRVIARFHDAGSHVQSRAQSEEERNRVRARHLPLPLWRLGNLALRVEHRLRRLAGQSI